MHDEIIINQEELDQTLPVSRDPEIEPQPKRWKSVLKKIAVGFVILVLAVVAFVAFNLLKVSVNPFGFGHLKGENEGRVNILLLGVGDPGHPGEGLSDTNIIVSVDTRNHRVATISVPRDLRVHIPGDGSAKVNSANATGGVKLARQTFEDTFGIPIHYYVKANFSGLKDVVDAVGGVDVDNPDNLNDPSYPCDSNENRSCGFKLNAGHYHLDGTTALKYVRCRKGTCGDDFGRAARQQQVMQSIRDRATSAGTLANPLALGKLISAAGNNIQTDLSVNNMLRLNELTKGATKSSIISVVFNLNPDGFLVASSNSSDLLPAGGDFEDIQNFVQNIFKFGPVWTEHPTLTIENGTSTGGLGARFSQKLKTDGQFINVVAVLNGASRDNATTQIIDYTGGKKPNTIGYLEGVLKVKATAPTAQTKFPPSDIVVILGNDYASTINASDNSTDSNLNQ